MNAEGRYDLCADSSEISEIRKMASRISSSRIVGLNWQKLKSPSEEVRQKRAKKIKSEKEKEDTDVTKSETDKNVKLSGNGRSKAFGDKILKVLDSENVTNVAGFTLKNVTKRANLVKNAVTTLRQKLKSSTKRRKRLVVATPSPFKADLISTPESVTRSGRLIRAHEVKMYSPFSIDSEFSTGFPRPRMGTRDRNNSRGLLGSPGSVGASLASDLENLANLNDDWMSPGSTKKLTRSKIRTTPRSARRSMRIKKPLFL